MLSHVLYDWGGGNVALFRLINGMHGPAWDTSMSLATRLTDAYPFGVLAAVACVSVAATRRRLGLATLEAIVVFGAAYVLGSALVWVLKAVIVLPRPVEALGADAVRLIAPSPDPFSFPSGHAARAALLVTSLWPCLALGMRVATALAVLWVATSRIALGVHFPTDVVGGVVIGVVTALLVRWAIESVCQQARARRENTINRLP